MLLCVGKTRKFGRKLQPREYKVAPCQSNAFLQTTLMLGTFNLGFQKVPTFLQVIFLRNLLDSPD